MTDAEIESFRTQLMADSWARTTDAPHACARALKIARGKRQIAAKAKALAQVTAAYNVWVAANRDGYSATVKTLWPSEGK